MLCVNFTANCKTVNYSVIENKNHILYERSQKALKEKKFEYAINILEKIKQNKICTSNLDKIYINLIYAYYKNTNLNTANNNIVKFIRLYPNHFNMDYIIYLKSLIDIEMDKNIFFKMPSVFYYKNNPIHAINAFFQLKNFIYRFPKSLYVINAKKNLMYLKNRLSEYDLKILKFYFSHHKYISVINRGEEIIQKYPETQSARTALLYIKKSYLALKIFETADKISKMILLNKIS